MAMDVHAPARVVWSPAAVAPGDGHLIGRAPARKPEACRAVAGRVRASEGGGDLQAARSASARALRRAEPPDEVEASPIDLSTSAWIDALSSSPIRPREKVPTRSLGSHRHGPPPPVLRCVVEEVAPLAQSREVARRVVLRVVVEVARRQEHPRPPHR
jgi:hypothetical protein